ncbi:MAG: hypothetical protein BGO95_10785 [Micrococcales bacterium 73-13]|nr:MAG: hypothetical protein BGO95_10785 [Micrococcales bacterium 73-13]
MGDQGGTRPSAGTPEGDPGRAAGWIFPMDAAVATTRAGLLAAGVGFGLVTAVLLALLAVLLDLVEPGSVPPWTAAALVPVAAVFVLAWWWDPLSVPNGVALALLTAASLALLTFAVAQSPAAVVGGTSAFPLTMLKAAVILLAAAADRRSGGVLGALAGYLLAEGSVLLTASMTGLPLRLDGPALAIMLGTAFVGGFFPIARSRARRATGSLEDADRRARLGRSREVERRELVAELHDTVLGDLTLLALRRPGPLSEAERGQLTASLASSAILPVLRADEGDLRSRLDAVAGAGGLVLVVDGDLSEVDALPESTRSAMASALEQCVVNVARHARIDAVRLGIRSSPESVEVLVDDEGVGFDPAAVPPDRFGLSESIRGRIEREGGVVELRSAPGEGTRVLIKVPREAAV